MRPRRTLVISDIHGALLALRECLVLSEYNQAEDRLIILGDYVGKHTHNPEVIETLLWLRATAKFTPIYIRGDQDRFCHNWLVSGKASPYWFEIGGKDTAKNYMKSKHLKSKAHKEFFESLVNFHVDDENRAYMHAGFYEDTGVGKSKYSSAYYFDTSLWGTSIHNTKEFVLSKRGIPQRFRSYLYNEVFVGHQPTTECEYSALTPELLLHKGTMRAPITKPMNRRNIWNVNTGVGGGHCLTIMDVETKQFWQSTKTEKLYYKKEVV